MRRMRGAPVYQLVFAAWQTTPQALWLKTANIYLAPSSVVWLWGLDTSGWFCWSPLGSADLRWACLCVCGQRVGAAGAGWCVMATSGPGGDWSSLILSQADSCSGQRLYKSGSCQYQVSGGLGSDLARSNHTLAQTGELGSKWLDGSSCSCGQYFLQTTTPGTFPLQ